MLQAKQKGFTLLELLVVITLLALLSVGALVVYDGVTDKAADATSANNIAVLNRALRQAAVVNNGMYPDQWDTILDEDGKEPCWTGKKDPNKDLASGGDCDGHQPMLADATKKILGSFALQNDDIDNSTSVSAAVVRALNNVGIRTLQTVDGLVPNKVASGLAFNEGGNPGVAEEVDLVDDDNKVEDLTLAIFPSQPVDEDTGLSAGTCQAGGSNLAVNLAGDEVPSTFLNKVSDRMESDECHFVVALGIGHDVAGWGAAGMIGLDTAATYNSSKVNAAYNYSRFIGLFLLASDDAGSNFDAGDIYEKARFVGVVDPEGRTADEAISGAFSSQTN